MILLVLLIILIVIFFIIINEFYLRRVISDSEIFFIRNVKKEKKYDYLSFGSSYCRYGLDLRDYNGYNLGMSGQFFYYTDKLLRYYAPLCLKEKGTVFLIIADLVFAEPGKGQLYPERYLSILPPHYLEDEYSFWKYLKHFRLALFFQPKRFLSILRYFIRGAKNNYDHTYTNPYSKEQTVIASKERCNAWIKQFGLKDTQSQDVPDNLEKKFEQTRRLLTNMIQFCLNNNYKVYLVVTPLSKIMCSFLSDSFLKRVLYDNIRQANVQNVPVLDYLKDERFSDYTLYDKSGDCLNTKGREMFTKVLLEDITSL